MTEVVVLGGGYAGIMAANQLAKSGVDAKITLINDRGDFQEKIRNHQLLAGTLSRKYAIKELLHPSVQLLETKVTALDPGKSVLYAGESAISYTYLIYAAGMVAGGEKPSSEDYALVADTKESERMARRLNTTPNGRITVAGGGLSGIETASELAERYPESQVTLLDPAPFGKNFSQKARQYMFDLLTRKGVVVLQDRILSMEPGRVRLASKRILEHDHCILATGLRATSLAQQAGLACDDRHRVLVDRFLHAAPGIIACGDAAVIEESPLRMSCAMALPTGAYAGKRVASLIKNGGAEMKGFHQDYTIRCVSMGRKKGLIQFVRADDAPKNFILKEGKGAFVKELVCKFTVKSL